MTAIVEMRPDFGFNGPDLDRLIEALEVRVQAREVLRIEQAAGFLSCSVRKINDMCAKGKLPYHRLEGFGGKLFLRSELIDYIKKH